MAHTLIRDISRIFAGLRDNHRMCMNVGMPGVNPALTNQPVIAPAVTPSATTATTAFPPVSAAVTADSSTAVTNAQHGAVGGALGGGAADAASAVAALQGILTALQDLVTRLATLVGGASPTVRAPEPSPRDAAELALEKAFKDQYSSPDIAPSFRSPLQTGVQQTSAHLTGQQALDKMTQLVDVRQQRISQIKAALEDYHRSTGSVNQPALISIEKNQQSNFLLQGLILAIKPHVSHLTSQQVDQMMRIADSVKNDGAYPVVAANDLMASIYSPGAGTTPGKQALHDASEIAAMASARMSDLTVQLADQVNRGESSTPQTLQAARTNLVATQELRAFLSRVATYVGQVTSSEAAQIVKIAQGVANGSGYDRAAADAVDAHHGLLRADV